VPKNLNIVFKVSPFAMGALIISTLILIGSFPLNISNIDSGVIALKPFNFKNLLLIASINSFAFTCHPSISPILKENANQANNKKAIFLGFFITAIMYTLVGIGGSLAIYGKKPAKV
jgi:amino acid permease